MTKSLVKQCIENIKASQKTFTKDVESDYAFLQKLMAVYICNDKKKMTITLKDYQEICGVYNFIKDKGYLIDKENCIDFNKLRYGFIKRVTHVVPNFLKKLYYYGPTQLCIIYINMLKNQEQLKEAVLRGDADFEFKLH